MKVFNVKNRELVDHLAREGFEIVGEIGDDTILPREWTMYGDERKLTNREKKGISFLDKLQRGGSKVWADLKRRKAKKVGFQIL